MLETEHPDRAAKEDSLLSQPYVRLNDLIDWVGVHGVEISTEIAQRITAYDTQWQLALAAQRRTRSILFPPEPKLVNIFRRGTAAGYLFEAFTELGEFELVWKNQLVTGNPLRLRSDERDRAMSMLGQTVQDARQVFWAILNGERLFDPAISVRYPVAMSRSEREWFDALVFETQEVLPILYRNPIVSGSESQSPRDGACDEEAMPPAAPKRQSAHPGGLDERKLEKQIKVYGFIRRLLDEENQPRYITSGDIAKCFGRCLEKTSTEWSKMLGDAPAWLAPARMSNFAKGTEAVWHPVMIASMLAQGVPVKTGRRDGEKGAGRKISLLILDRVFEAHAELSDWRAMWGRESELNRDFDTARCRA